MHAQLSSDKLEFEASEVCFSFLIILLAFTALSMLWVLSYLCLVSALFRPLEFLRGCSARPGVSSDSDSDPSNKSLNELGLSKIFVLDVEES